MEATHCTVPGCERPIFSRVLCSLHYNRMLRHGTFEVNHPRGGPASERFFAKVDISVVGGCWLWMASANSRGYGYFYVGRKTVYAHRWSYEYHIGPIGDLHIMHSCDNPPCVNPAHLSPGTPADNAADKVAKGRSKTAACLVGHAWTVENTYTRVNNGRIVRVCRACRRKREQQARARK